MYFRDQPKRKDLDRFHWNSYLWVYSTKSQFWAAIEEEEKLVSMLDLQVTFSEKGTKIILQ